MYLLVASNMNFTGLDVNVLMILGLEKCLKILDGSAAVWMSPMPLILVLEF